MKLSEELELEAGYQDEFHQDEFDHCVVRDKLKNLANNAEKLEDRIKELEDAIKKVVVIDDGFELLDAVDVLARVLKGDA